jgi:hypothetical protein
MPFLERTIKHWMVEGVPYVALKSAQNMITWLGSCLNVWEVLFRKNITNGYFSIGQKEASFVKDRCQFILDHIPPKLLPEHIKQVGESKLEIKIEHAKSEYSIIRFMHSSEKAGRSVSFYRVMLDEMAFMQHAEEIYNANRTRCRFLNAFSTPPKGRVGYFLYLYDNALELGIQTDLLHYSENRYKDDAWKKRMRRGMSQERWDREQECKIVADGGLVYKNFSREANVVPRDLVKLSPAMRFYRGIDWGWTAPFVHLWVCSWDEGSVTRWHIFKEIYKTETHLKELATEILSFDNTNRNFTHEDGQSENFKIAGRFTAEISDCESPRERHVMAEYGVRTIPCKKGKGSVSAKIDELGTLLEPSPFGGPQLTVSEDCIKLIFEFENYVYKEVAEGEHDAGPLKRFDHALDALADIVYTTKHMNQPKQKVRFTY